MLVTCTGLSSSFSSTSSLPTTRQVKSQPPPGLDGAMHSTFPGVKAISGRASTARPATRPSLDIIISRSPTRSEEHTSELQSLMRISYAVFCLKKKKKQTEKDKYE